MCVRNNLAAQQKPWSCICFHAQQAAEKYLKAYLVSRQVEPEWIHALDRLLADCIPFDPALSALKEDCIRLSAYAVDARYPDVPIVGEEHAAREAVAAGERICEVIRQRLPKG